MTADDATNEAMNVGGTRHALELAHALDVGHFHQVSSVAAAGEYHGTFDETMFAEGQHLPSAYHRTKYESERIVREEAQVPWRVYRPAIVVGHSETGAMDKVDGPYYFFPAMKALRDTLPAWLPLVGVDLGRHQRRAGRLRRQGDGPPRASPGPRRRGVPPRQPGPAADRRHGQLVLQGRRRADASPPRVDRNVTGAGPLALIPRRLRPLSLATSMVKLAPVQAALDLTLGRTGIPAEVLAHSSFTARFDSRRTEKALAGSGIAVPDLEGYARTLWGYWEEHLDEATGRDPKIREALKGKHVVITGASSGIGQVVALKVAQAGGIPVLVARGKDKLEETRATIERRGGTAYVFPCDLSDLEAIDGLCEQLSTELPSVDFVVNNAGRSIRRSLRLSHDRFHDFERTMQLNYFGAIRLVMGLIPAMKKAKRGHVVNISSIGVQTNPPRFSAYVASKSALDSWSNVVSSELVGDGITFTGIHMPLVRTPMIAPTKIYDKFPTISPAQAADLVIRAMVERPHEINTLLGNVGAVAHTVAPKLAFRLLNMAYHVFPDSAAAKGEVPAGGTRESEQIMLAKVFKGIHW